MSQMTGTLTNERIKQLCLDLVNADSEDDVIRLLDEAGYWNDRRSWRYLDDNPGNYSSIGNQQSNPDAALAEKLVNSIDARLTNECLVRGMRPDGDLAPSTIREAVAIFFEGHDAPIPSYSGLIRNWENSKRLKVSSEIALAATGSRSRPSFTIADIGEGQTPRSMPTTFLSLSDSNKMNIPFVQGRFQMGGTGALQFCGRRNLQLIVTKRNPTIFKEFPDEVDETSEQWGLTVVRREDPAGNRRNSVFTYLAPVVESGPELSSEVLSFSADSLPILPDANNAYTDHLYWGTLVKLYEYRIPKASHILLGDGLLHRLNLLLAEPALPIRLHECRDYKGHAGSFANTLMGLKVRLDDNRGDNLEAEFPVTATISVNGKSLPTTIYAFLPGKSDGYRSSEGIVFCVNGQTHGTFSDRFFARQSIGLSSVRKSLLVLIECANLEGRDREDLFMNSRDRLLDSELKREIEKQLESLLSNHQGLRDLRERRRRQEVEERIANDQSLTDVIQSVLSRSRALTNMFAQGSHIRNPFKPENVESKPRQFEGKQFPTYFHFRGKKPAESQVREVPINRRPRIEFETDVENSYFERDIDPGHFEVMLKDGDHTSTISTYTRNLFNGIATVNLTLPDWVQPGSVLNYYLAVSDNNQLAPFELDLTLRVTKAAQIDSSNSTRRYPPADRPGQDRQRPSGLDLPTCRKVTEGDQKWDDLAFDFQTALVIQHAPVPGDSGETRDTFDFFVNADNIHLHHYLKYDLPKDSDPQVAENQFEVGMVLIGLAKIHAWQTEDTTEAKDVSALEDDVRATTRAIAPFLLPMIESLASVQAEQTIPE